MQNVSVNLFKFIQPSSKLKIWLHFSSPSRSKPHFYVSVFFDGIIFSPSQSGSEHDIFHISEILGIGIIVILL